MNIALCLAGFLFLYIIIILNIAVYRYGYEIFSELDSETKLQKINKDPRKFKISVALVITEHLSIIGIPIMLFIAFYSTNIILAVVWTISRTGEGLIQIYKKKSYWGLLKLAKQYSGASGAEKKALIDSGRSILISKNSIFRFAQILFSVGTLAYSIFFVVYGVVPVILGWFGIVASILYGFGNGILYVKPKFKALWSLGGLLILIYEAVLGGWLLYYSIIVL